MDSSLEGVMFDPSRCSKMSVEEKRELVYELSKWSHGATDLLKTWSRQDILQILCAEMGKERKYTGLTKLKIIENLMKIVSEKKLGESQSVLEADQHSIPASVQKGFKRQRKTDDPSRLPCSSNKMSNIGLDSSVGPAIYCKNSACKALMKSEDAFCRRCSCCICYKYDDNKDPSLWLNCSSESPFQGKSCGLSCHLECAFRNGNSGIGKDGRHAVLDGSFYCVSCGKLNDLLGCWRKQVVIAKETRRVDILCYRVSLSQKLISGTKMFHKIYEIVDEAVKKLEEELGPITGLPVKTARGIVNRLDSGAEVQKICATAIDLLDSMLCKSNLQPMPNYNHQSLMLVVPDVIRLEDVSATSATVVLASEASSSGDIVDYLIWYRKASDVDYPVEPVCSLSAINSKFIVSGLSPATEYIFTVVSSAGYTSEVRMSTSRSKQRETYPRGQAVERSQSLTVNCSSLSNPSSVEDETNNVAHFIERNENSNSDYDIDYCNGNDKIISGKQGRSSASMDVGQKGTQADSVSMLDEEGLAEKNSSKPNSDSLKNNNHVPESQPNGTNDNDSDTVVPTGLECVPFVSSSEGGLITPCKLENSKDGHGKRSKNGRNDMSDKAKEPQGGGSSSKKGGADKSDDDDDFARNNSSLNRDFAYYVNVIRWLECEGYIEANFRQKFLTWYSLRASTQETRIVKVFVDAFIEDPASLAGQLVDTFSETASSKGSSKSSVVPAGLCMKLWH